MATRIDEVPERLVIRGLRLVKSRARRHDIVGEAAYRYLKLLHGGLGTAARTLARFEEASQPPTRPAERARTETSPKRKPE